VIGAALLQVIDRLQAQERVQTFPTSWEMPITDMLRLFKRLRCRLLDHEEAGKLFGGVFKVTPPQVERLREIVPSLEKEGRFQDAPAIEPFQLDKLLECCDVDHEMRATVGFNLMPGSTPPNPSSTKTYV
jgi:hypothetical protein